MAEGGGGAYPPGWNAAPPAGGDDDHKIFDNDLRVNEGIEIEHDIRIEVVEVNDAFVGSAKFRISSYMMPAETHTIYKGDSPMFKYKTYNGSYIYIDVISVRGDRVEFTVTGPADWRVTDYYEVGSGEPTIPATDTDGDGVPDAWDEEPDTPAGYLTDSEGRGQRWGDMNGDGWLTSVDALMLLKAVTGGTGLAPTPRPPKPIYLDKYAMVPKTPMIRAGEALNWINNQKAPMTTYTLVSEDGLWDNQSISYGKKFKYTFDTPGNYSYYCAGYGNAMHGTVTVT